MATAHTLQEISRMKRDEGIDRLSRCFHWTEFDADRQFLHQQFVYDVVMLAVTRGLSWSTVEQLANITKNLLPKLKGVKTSEVISLISGDLSQIEPPLSAAHHAFLLDSIVKTYVPHRRLYQAVLNAETGVRRVRCELEVEIPPHPQPLREGLDAEEWEHQRVREELKSKQARTQEEIRDVKDMAEAQMKGKLEDTLNHLPGEGHMSKREVVELLRRFVQTQGEILMECVMKKRRLTEGLLQIRLSLETPLTQKHCSDLPRKQSVATPVKAKKEGKWK